jgi:Long-chain acyl-CoA synthetases (AMP-forming)
MHAEAAKACETTGVPLYLVSLGDGPLPDGTRSALELISSAPLEEPGGDVAARDPDDTAVLVYTSGTTGGRRAPSSPTSSCT